MIVGSAEVLLTTDGSRLPTSIRDDLDGSRPVVAAEGAALGREFGDAFSRDAGDSIRSSGGPLESAFDRGEVAATAGSAAGESFGDAFTRDSASRVRDSNGRFVKDGESAGDNFTKGFLSRLGGGGGKGLLSGVFDRDRDSASALTTVVGQLSVRAASAGAFLATWGPAIIAAGAAVVPLLPSLAVAVPAIAGIAGVAAVVALSGKQLLSAIEPLKDGVEGLSSAVGGALTKGFAGDIRDLAEDILPILRVGLVDLAQVLNGAVRPLLQFADSAEGLSLIRDLIGGVTTAMKPLFDLLLPIAQIFLNLGVAAVPALTQLSTAVAGLVTRFADFVTKATASGDLAGIIATSMTALLDVFSGLGGVLSPLIQLFARFGPAVLAGLGAVLSAVGDGLQALVGVVDSVSAAVASGDSVLQPLIDGALAFAAAVGPQLVPTFQALGTFVLGLVPIVAGVLGPALAGLGDIIGGQLLPAIQTGLPMVSAVITAVVTGITTVLASVAGGADLLNPIIAGIQAFAAAVGPQLAPTFEAVASFAAGLLPTLVDIGTQIVGVVGPALASIGQIIGEELLPAFQAVLPVIQPVARFILEVIGGAIVGALKGAVNVIEGVLRVITGIFNVFAGVFTGDWSKAWQGIKQIFSGAFQAILGLVEVFLNVGILKGFRVGIDLLKGLWNDGLKLVESLIKKGLGAMESAASSGLSAVLSLFAKLPGRIVSALGSLLKLLVGKGSDVVEGLLNGIEKIAPKVLSFVKGVPGKIVSALGNLGTLLVSAGREVLQGLLNGATQLLPSVASFFGNKVVNAVENTFKSALGISSPSKVFTQHGKDIIAGLIKGIEDDSASAEKAMDKLAQRVAARYEVATDRLKTLQDQRTAFFTSVRDAAISGADAFSGDAPTGSSIKEALRSQIIDINEFTTSLAKLKRDGINATTYQDIVNLGVDKGETIAKALAQEGPAGISELNSLQTLLTAKAGALGKTTSGNLFDAGVAAAAGLVAGIRSERASILEASRELAKDMEDAGADAARGLAKGLQSHRKDITKAVGDMADDLIKKIKADLKIKSPSEVFADIGKEIPAGLALGIDGARGVVSDASARMAQASLFTPDVGQLQALAEAQSRATLSTTLAVGRAPAAGRTNVYNIDATNMTAAELRRELDDRDQLDAALHPGGL